MPLYAYECQTCSHEFERQQSFSEDPIKVCPNCGQPSARRLFKPVGIIFKGSGFYITDSRKALGDGKSAANSSSPASTSKESNSVSA